MFKLSKLKITNTGLYLGLIITFALLYLCVGFVSTLHSITFFHLANTIGLAILLGLTYEVGQASVLFSILMTRNKDKFLPWVLMFLLTALQVTANVYASYKFMIQSGSNDWTFWRDSILFGVQASSDKIYQVIISWISGALLPVVALGMTALVAQNIKLAEEENKNKKALESTSLNPDQMVDAKDIISEVSKVRPTEEELKDLETILKSKVPIKEVPKEETFEKKDNDENHQKFLDDLGKENEALVKAPDEDLDDLEEDIPADDDEFGPVDLTNEVPDQISPEDIKSIKEEAQNLSPIIIENNNGLVENVIPIPQLESVDKEEENVSEPQDTSPEHLESQRLEKLREIARNNLKKK